jgi:hypothetical protein
MLVAIPPLAEMTGQSRFNRQVSRFGTDRFLLPTCGPPITLAARFAATTP